ncbi:MAG: hypothetical protein EBT24_12775 [Betaproteobacteria bacterium]|nr:hypothetical protein [Betaproteobacteria bacterium]
MPIKSQIATHIQTAVNRHIAEIINFKRNKLFICGVSIFDFKYSIITVYFVTFKNTIVFFNIIY